MTPFILIMSAIVIAAVSFIGGYVAGYSRGTSAGFTECYQRVRGCGCSKKGPE